MGSFLFLLDLLTGLELKDKGMVTKELFPTQSFVPIPLSKSGRFMGRETARRTFSIQRFSVLPFAYGTSATIT